MMTAAVIQWHGVGGTVTDSGSGGDDDSEGGRGCGDIISDE
jgi:hypothetical protein